MLESRSVHAVAVDNRAEKRAAYRSMATAAYPMLYALSADIATYDAQLYPHVDQPTVVRMPGFPLTTKTPDLTTTMRNLAPIAYEPAPYKVHSILAYDLPHYSESRHSVVATNPHDRDLYFKGQIFLVDSIGRIGRSDSHSSTVAKQFGKCFPAVDSHFTLRDGQAAIIDGVFSAYSAATWLSQMPIEGQEDMTTRDRLLTVLRSSVVSDFTKTVGLGIIPRLSTVDIVPQHQLVLASDGDLQVHDDTAVFIEAFNSVEAFVPPQPMLCPFAVPLGAAQVEKTIEDYNGTIPDSIAQMMRQHAYTTGITIAGNAIATYLESQI